MNGEEGSKSEITSVELKGVHMGTNMMSKQKEKKDGNTQNETGRDSKRQKKTDRDRQRQTETDRDRQRETETDRYSKRHTDRQAYRGTVIDADQYYNRNITAHASILIYCIVTPITNGGLGN